MAYLGYMVSAGALYYVICDHYRNNFNRNKYIGTAEEIPTKFKINNKQEFISLNPEEHCEAKRRFNELKHFTQQFKPNTLCISNDNIDYAYIDECNNIILDYKLVLPSSVYKNCKNKEILPKFFSNIQLNKVIILHELGHIEYNHINKLFYIKCAIALSLGLIFSHRFGKYMCIGVCASSIYLKRQYEHDADAYAVNHGYGNKLIKHFNNVIEYNKLYGSNNLIRSTGEQIMAIGHPLYRHRIAHITHLISNNELDS